MISRLVHCNWISFQFSSISRCCHPPNIPIVDMFSKYKQDSMLTSLDIQQTLYQLVYAEGSMLVKINDVNILILQNKFVILLFFHVSREGEDYLIYTPFFHLIPLPKAGFKSQTIWEIIKRRIFFFHCLFSISLMEQDGKQLFVLNV